MNKSCGPARALRDVWVKPWTTEYVAHRFTTLSGFLFTTPQAQQQIFKRIRGAILGL
jgi:hypothetical protein